MLWHAFVDDQLTVISDMKSIMKRLRARGQLMQGSQIARNEDTMRIARELRIDGEEAPIVLGQKFLKQGP